MHTIKLKLTIRNGKISSDATQMPGSEGQIMEYLQGLSKKANGSQAAVVVEEHVHDHEHQHTHIGDHTHDHHHE